VVIFHLSCCMAKKHAFKLPSTLSWAGINWKVDQNIGKIVMIALGCVLSSRRCWAGIQEVQSALVRAGLLKTCRSSRLSQIVLQSLLTVRLTNASQCCKASKTFLWLMSLPVFPSVTLPLSGSLNTSVDLFTVSELQPAFYCFLASYLPARPAAILDKPHHSQCHHYPPLCWKCWRHSQPSLWKLLWLFDCSLDPFNRSSSLPRDIAGLDSLWTHLTPFPLINQFLSPISLCQSALGSLLVCIGYSISVTKMFNANDSLDKGKEFSVF